MTLDQYKLLFERLATNPPSVGVIRYLARTDLFFLLVYCCGRSDIFHPWLLARCQEIQANPNGYLDLWAREHYKSTLITFGLTIQDILSSHGDAPLDKWGGREVTFGIFSFNRPIAKAFLRQIKLELETNELLKDLFPDVLYANPRKQSPKWSEDDGIVVKRKGNVKESTVEAWGLIDGMPTSKHYFIRVYDDLLTHDSSRSMAAIEKTSAAWENSINLGASGGYERYAGTRYHYNDTYSLMLRRKVVTPRIYTPYDDDGNPLLKTQAELDKKRAAMGTYTWACQMLQDPNKDDKIGFKLDWIKHYESNSFSNMNLYLLCDPANSKKKKSDYTVMCVIALGMDHNYYLIDMVRDKLTLSERSKQYIYFHQRYRPKVSAYEEYGMQADVSYIKEKMEESNYRFTIKPVGGNLSKVDRIRKLIPIFEEGRFYLPKKLYKTDFEKKSQDLIKQFLEDEYETFPVGLHDDMLDCMARILDNEVGASFPISNEVELSTLSQQIPAGF